MPSRSAWLQRPSVQLQTSRSDLPCCGVSTRPAPSTDRSSSLTDDATTPRYAVDHGNADPQYPFDIQHRTIVTYTTESSSDFEKLRESLAARIKAQAEKGEALRQFAETEQVAPLEGLSQPELFVLAAVAGDTTIPDTTTSAHSIKVEVERAGLTNIGFSLGLRRLMAKGFIRILNEQDYNGNPYQTLTVTEPGWAWIEKNESKFVVRRTNVHPTTFADLDDDIPF